MQVIAKVVLAVLGIYSLVNFCRTLTFVVFELFDNCSFAVAANGVGISIVFIIALLYFLIFRNDWLAVKIAGPGERLSPANQRIWLAASLRAGAVFCGLILLAGSTRLFGNILFALWLPNIRRWITQILNSGGFFNWTEFFSRRGATGIYDFLKAVLAVYLLCGAPQFVRRQLKTAVTAGGADSPNLSDTNSEGIQNE